MYHVVSAIFFAFFAAASPTFAGDVYVDGYYRSDGTYVRPHVRSSPDGITSNNYGPSTSSSQLLNPRRRDYDGDGTSNYLDMNSDNDSLLDNSDPNPFGSNSYFD